MYSLPSFLSCLTQGPSRRSWSSCVIAVSLCVAGQAASAQTTQGNLIRNPGFEEGTASWSQFVPQGASRDAFKWEVSADKPHSGAKCFHLQSSKAERFGIGGEELPVQPGQRYKVSAWVRVPAGFSIASQTPGVVARVDYASSDGSLGKYHVMLTVGNKVANPATLSAIANSSLPAEWTQMSAVYEVPEGATKMRLELFMWSGVGETFWDDIELAPVGKSTPLTPVATAASAAAKKAEAEEISTVTPEELMPENPAWAAHHPRIVLDKATLEHARAAIKEAGTPPAMAWQRIEAECKAILGSSSRLDMEHPFGGLADITVTNHKSSGALEGGVRMWTTACDRLAFHYAISGDVASGKAAAKIALVIARKLGPESPAVNRGFFYTRTFLLRSMALTFDWCYPLMTPEERQDLRAGIGAYSRKFYSTSMNSIWGQSTLGRMWNWNPGIASAWGLGMLAIMDETNLPDQQWVFQAARNVEDYFRFGVDQKGAGMEGPSYLSYGAGASFYFMESLRQWSGEDLFNDTHMKLFTNWVPYEMLPDGVRVNNLCDSGYKMAYADCVTYSMARLKDTKNAEWIWQNLWDGKNGISWDVIDDAGVILWWRQLPATKQPDLPLGAFAPTRGVMVSRSGWDKDSVYFSMHAQVYTVIKHDQADKGQFTLYGYGEDFAIDSGYANDGDVEKSVNTKAHNLILINGVGQATENWHAQTSARFGGFLHSDAADWGWVNEKDAYEYTVRTPKKNGADGVAYTKKWQNHILQANRQALFIRGKLPYVVLFDDIQKDDKEQTYSWLLHTCNGKAFDVEGSTVTILADKGMGEITKVAVQPPGLAGGNSVEALLAGNSPKTGTWKKEINIPADGKYIIWGLAGTEEKNSGAADSFFFSIDGGKADFTKGQKPKEFAWATRAATGLAWVGLNDNNGNLEVPALSLKAGKHVLELKTREEGARMGAVCLVPEGAVMEDAIAAKTAILIQAAEGQVAEPMKLVDVGFGKEKGIMQMTVLSPATFQTQKTMFETTRDGSHPRLEIKTKAVAPNFLMVLVPRPVDPKAKDSKPAPIVKPVAMKKGVAGIVSAAQAGDDLVARWDGTGIENDKLATNAQLFWMRGEPAKGCAAVRGSSVSWRGKPLFEANSEAAFVFDGKALQVSGKEVSEVRHAFGSGVKLFINGNEVKASAEKGGLAVWKK